MKKFLQAIAATLLLLTAPAALWPQQVGRALYDKGFKTTAWLDVETGQLRRGVFDPSATDPAARYGNPLGMHVRGWVPENYVGAHSTGDNSKAVDLAPKVLGVQPGGLDALDLNFVSGGTRYVLDQARIVGLLTEAAPTGPDTPQAKCPPPTEPKCPAAEVPKCDPPVALVAPPADVVAAAREALGWVTVGPGRRAQLAKISRWLDSLESVKVKTKP
jgi:hypothetical protein